MDMMGRIEALSRSGVLPPMEVAAPGLSFPSPSPPPLQLHRSADGGGMGTLTVAELNAALDKEKQRKLVMEAAIRKEKAAYAELLEENAKLKRDLANALQTSDLLKRDKSRLQKELADSNESLFALAEKARRDREECVSDARAEMQRSLGATASPLVQQRPNNDDAQCGIVEDDEMEFSFE